MPAKIEVFLAHKVWEESLSQSEKFICSFYSILTILAFIMSVYSVHFLWTVFKNTRGIRPIRIPKVLHDVFFIKKIKGALSTLPIRWNI